MKTNISDALDTAAVALAEGITEARVRQLRYELKLVEGRDFILFKNQPAYFPAGIVKIRKRNTKTGWAGRKVLKSKANGSHRSRSRGFSEEKV